MIIFTASDSSAGEEKNLDPSKDANWFDLPSTASLQRVEGGLGKMIKTSGASAAAFLRREGWGAIWTGHLGHGSGPLPSVSS